MTGPLPAIKRAFMKKGDVGACQWNLLISSLAKVGGKENIPVECKAKRITITLDDLIPYEKEAKERINTYIKRKDVYGQKDPKFQISILDFYNNPNDKKQVLAWTLLKKLADETKECWDKVLKGKMDVFSNWYWPLIENPYYCIICSRIKIGEDVVKNIKAYLAEEAKKTESTPGDLWPSIQEKKNQLFISPNLIKLWMIHNRPPNEEKSYYEYVLENSDSFFIRNRPPPWGIIYLRTNMQKAGQWFNVLAKQIDLEKKESENNLVMWDYNTIGKSADEGGLGCTAIID